MAVISKLFLLEKKKCIWWRRCEFTLMFPHLWSPDNFSAVCFYQEILLPPKPILWTFFCFWKLESALPGQTVGHYALCPLRFEKHTLGRYHSLSLFYKDRNKLANAGDVRKVRYCFSSQSARVSNIRKQKTTTGNWLYHPAYFFSFSLSISDDTV